MFEIFKKNKEMSSFLSVKKPLLSEKLILNRWSLCLCNNFYKDETSPFCMGYRYIKFVMNSELFLRFPLLSGLPSNILRAHLSLRGSLQDKRKMKQTKCMDFCRPFEAGRSFEWQINISSSKKSQRSIAKIG